MPSSIAVQSLLPSSHAAHRALRGLESTTPSLFSPSKLKVRTLKNYCPSVTYVEMVVCVWVLVDAARALARRRPVRLGCGQRAGAHPDQHHGRGGCVAAKTPAPRAGLSAHTACGAVSRRLHLRRRGLRAHRAVRLRSRRGDQSAAGQGVCFGFSLFRRPQRACARLRRDGLPPSGGLVALGARACLAGCAAGQGHRPQLGRGSGPARRTSHGLGRRGERNNGLAAEGVVSAHLHRGLRDGLLWV